MMVTMMVILMIMMKKLPKTYKFYGFSVKIFQYQGFLLGEKGPTNLGMCNPQSKLLFSADVFPQAKLVMGGTELQASWSKLSMEDSLMYQKKSNIFMFQKTNKYFYVLEDKER